MKKILLLFVLFIMLPINCFALENYLIKVEFADTIDVNTIDKVLVICEDSFLNEKIYELDKSNNFSISVEEDNVITYISTNVNNDIVGTYVTKNISNDSNIFDIFVSLNDPKNIISTTKRIVSDESNEETTNEENEEDAEIEDEEEKIQEKKEKIDNRNKIYKYIFIILGIILLIPLSIAIVKISRADKM